MKVRAALAIAPFALLLAVACASGVGAEVPPEVPGIPSSPLPYPTSTPWPQFGPPPVTADSIIPTVQAAPDAPGGTPQPDSTSTSEAATPTPVVITGPSARPGSEQAPTPFDSSGTFEPLLTYSYLLPRDWEEIVGDDETVIVHRSGDVHVSLRERTVDRSFFKSIIEVGQSQEPTDFVDWSERSLFDVRVTGPYSYRLEYAGTKLGEQRIAIVEWHLWGELLVEVVIEADASVWAQNTNLRNTARLVAASFTPDASASLVEASQVENLLRVRFGQKLSNVFVTSETSAGQVELSCRQVLNDLLSEPVYVRSGQWQVFAVTQQGAQVWQVFEPTLNIVPAEHNTSTC